MASTLNEAVSWKFPEVFLDLYVPEEDQTEQQTKHRDNTKDEDISPNVNNGNDGNFLSPKFRWVRLSCKMAIYRIIFFHHETVN